MVDRIFSEPTLAELYDLLAPWGDADDRFYMKLVMSASSVLDVGCGTGLLLRQARKAGHTGRLCGLDPAKAMLDVASRCSDVEWVLGDLGSVSWNQEFDLIVMTGHAFQVFVEDDEIIESLMTMRSALTDRGRVAFETRNLLAQEWENWVPSHVTEVMSSTGAIVRFSRQVERPVEGNVIKFTSTFTSPSWDEPERSHSTLRFHDVNSLTQLLSEAGLTIEQQFGDWDRQPLTETSPEIITTARR